MISAKEAFELSKSGKERKIEIQLNAVCENIREEAKKGNTFINYKLHLEEDTIKRLKELGFMVKGEFTECNEEYYVIRWENAEREEFKKGTWFR